MKKYFKAIVLISICGTALVSCDERYDKIENGSCKEDYLIRLPPGEGNIRVRTFNDNGHSYRLYSKTDCYYGGVVHDPDCPCHNKE